MLRTIHIIALILLLAGCSPSDVVQPPEPFGLGDPIVPEAGNAGYDAVEYVWDLTVDPSTGSLEAAAEMSAVASADLDEIVLDFAGPAVSKVRVNGSVAAYEQEGGKLVIEADVESAAGFEVFIEYEGTPSSHGTVGWMHQQDLVFTAQLLPGDTSSWVPLNDSPLDPALYRVRVNTPPGHESVASGTVTDGEWWSVSPSVTEFGFAAGELESKEFDEAASPAITMTVPAGRPFPTTELAVTRNIIEHHAGYLGEFPFPTLGWTRVAGPPGANSTPGQIFYTVLDPLTISHEVAHQWIGGSTGTASSRDSWLREGIPEYLAFAWSAEKAGSDLAERLKAIHESLGETTRALLEVDEPADRSDRATYQRGALSIHALRVAIGDFAFREGLMDFVARFTGKAATTADFIATMQEHTDIDVAATLSPWIDAEPMPPWFD